MSGTLLATKVHIPPLHGNLVNRARLIRRLNEGIVRDRLTLICAPAGYGKSTLLSEWVSQVGIPAAWLSLEKGENIPARFWNYFISALQTIPYLHQAGIGEAILQALRSSQPVSMDVLLVNLINDFSQLGEGAVLVLDDLHAVTESQIHQDLVYLMDHLPFSNCGLHLVVASRMDPPWPLARWRARGELNELRPADLRFNSDETVRFLNQFLELKLSLQDIAALQDRTEGWIAGLQMAALSMQGRIKTQGSQGISHFIETFAGSHRFIMDYLMEEVISQQPAEMLDFLHETSILEQLTASLCNALTSRHDGQTMLDQVERANLFLIPLDDERHWYRYHHLFAELLRKRLKQTMPDHFAELHRRACKWYTENNFLSEAVSHAIDAGDFPLVNELVSGNVLALMEHAELLVVFRHFEQIPDRQMAANPWLGVAYAWTKAYVDPAGDIERILQQVEQGFIGGEKSLERQHLSSHLKAIRAYVAWVRGEADEALTLARNALENLPEDDWAARRHILNIEGLALQYLGDLDGAIQSFEAAIAAGQRAGKAYETFHAYTNLSFAVYLKCQLHQAFSLCQHVLYLADQSDPVSRQMPILAYAYATMSMVQLEWNAVESAIANARQGIALAEQWKQADTLHYTLNCLSEALCAAGNLEESFAVNQRAMQLANKVSPWYYRISVFNEIWLNLVKGEIVAAAQKFAEIEPQVEERNKKGKFLTIKVSLLYAQGRFQEVMTALEGTITEIKQMGMNCAWLELIVLQALALQGLGREEEALDILGQCLALAKTEGFVRIFLERGAPMVRLLQLALNRGIETEFIRELLPAFDIPGASQTSRLSGIPQPTSQFQSAELAEPLSEREIQVLRLLDSPLTNAEIGRELYVSVNTIRTHVRNIYAKLGVKRRGEAVWRAKNLKLI